LEGGGGAEISGCSLPCTLATARLLEPETFLEAGAREGGMHYWVNRDKRDSGSREVVMRCGKPEYGKDWIWDGCSGFLACLQSWVLLTAAILSVLKICNAGLKTEKHRGLDWRFVFVEL
jgi:hypothetical protein